MQSHATSKCIQCVHHVLYTLPPGHPSLMYAINHKWKVCCRAYCKAIFSQKTPTPLSRNNPHNDTWFRKKKAIQTCKQQVGNKLNGIAGGPERPQSFNHQFRFNKSIIPQLRYQCNSRLLVPSSKCPRACATYPQLSIKHMQSVMELNQKNITAC